jgi:hypothetical protein
VNVATKISADIDDATVTDAEIAAFFAEEGVLV